ncbi:hypothetical protein GQX74_013853 [Glossina fuscipes]|nr:hypothetical protein GQX74_013853 [Glossina fuscipes]
MSGSVLECRETSFASGSTPSLMVHKSKLNTLGRILKPWKWRENKTNERFSKCTKFSKILIPKSVEVKILMHNNGKELMQECPVFPSSPLRNIQRNCDDSLYENTIANSMKNNCIATNGSIASYDNSSVSVHNSGDNDQSMANAIGLQPTTLPKYPLLAEQLRKRLATRNNDYHRSTSISQCPFIFGQYVTNNRLKRLQVFNIPLAPTMEKVDNAKSILIPMTGSVRDKNGRYGICRSDDKVTQFNRASKASLSLKLRSNSNKQQPPHMQEREEIIVAQLIKQLSIRPTAEQLIQSDMLETHTSAVKELKEKKIIRFNDDVKVAQAHDYDRRGYKSWKKWTLKERAAICKELNKFKTSEMEFNTDFLYAFEMKFMRLQFCESTASYRTLLRRMHQLNMDCIISVLIQALAILWSTMFVQSGKEQCWPE